MNIEKKANYLRVRNQKILADDYRINMIIKNKIDGLMRMKISLVDGDVEISYDTENKISLREYYHERKLNYEDIKEILQSMTVLSHTIKKYLLKLDDILFQISYIYKDLESNRIFFCYLPENEENAIDSIRTLIQELMRLTEHTDLRAVELIYRALEECESRDFRISKFDDLVRKSVVSEISVKHKDSYEQKNQNSQFYMKVSELEDNYHTDLKQEIRQNKKGTQFLNKITKVLKGQ